MPSLIKGYEYDIFISYRQKDNKADKWVSHFVEALKDEIEATFKEDICVYFDENPHDGLLETHDVDQSLSEKIKVLVFIPIISQTYCDPNCFAWQHEFIAFRDFAKEDDLGLNIRLASGNVCKRILPVRIHEIDTTDQALFEKEVGGVMRPIDFIFKSSGVNRALRHDEDNPHDNLNKTFYRDQINKVANGVKEIIDALQYGDSDNESNIELSREQEKLTTSKSKISNKAISITSLLVLLLAFIAIWYFKFYNQPQVLSEASRNARVAIIPFTNNTNDQELDILGDMAADWITKGLMNFDYIKVVSYETVKNNIDFALLKDSNMRAGFIDRTGADKLINGSFYLQDNDIVLQTQLIDVKTGEVELVLPLVIGTKSNLGGLVSDLNQRVMSIFGLEENFPKKPILNDPPKYDAYKSFHSGWKYFGIDYDKCREYFFNAIEQDSTFFWPYYFSALAYQNEGKILNSDAILAIANTKCKPYSVFQNLCLDWLNASSNKEKYSAARKIHQMDPKNYLVNLGTGQSASYLNKPNEAINIFSKLDPKSFSFHSPAEIWWFDWYSYNLVRLNKLDEALEVLEAVPPEFMDDLYYTKALAYVLKGQHEKIHNMIAEMEGNGVDRNLIIETYLYTSNWYALQGDSEKKREWANLALGEINALPNSYKIEANIFAWAYFNSGDYESAILKYQNLTKTIGRTEFYLSKIGLCHAKSDSPDMAKSIINELDSLNTQYSNYAIAQIYSALNEQDLSVKYLNQAFNADHSFRSGRYDTDRELLPLHGHPGYEELIKPKG